MHLFLTFSAALGIARSNKYVGLALALPNALQFYSFSTDVWRRLGIVQASLASALALHKRSEKARCKITQFLSFRCTRIWGKLTNFAIFRYERTEIGVAQTNGSDTCEPLP